MHGRQQGVKSPPVSKARDQHADEEERGLIQRLTAGDHEAFETLFQRYFTTVYRQAMRLSAQQAGNDFPLRCFEGRSGTSHALLGFGASSLSDSGQCGRSWADGNGNFRVLWSDRFHR
jgi:hypothetical protein